MRRLPDGRVVLDGDVPPVAMSFATTGWNRTGVWRSREPVFRDRTAPCAAACPAGEDIADQLRLAAQGRMAEAGELVLSVNPLPATTGRVCPHPCAAACNRATLDGAVDIPGVERALGDALLVAGIVPRPARPLGLRTAVVGAGPAGLAAAHRLALAGARVRLLAPEDRPGGLLLTGIPPYRLPRAVLDAEIARTLALGVTFEGGRRIGAGLQLATLAAEHDAVLLAVGRHAPRGLAIPGAAAAGVVEGLALLARIHRGEPAPPGEAVAVIGGGNTALDCARTLVRLGRRVTVVYRRGRADMPAFADEIEEALEEGIAIEEWLLPTEVIARGGRTRWIRLQRARPGAPDASGRPRPEPIRGEGLVLPADLVVVAVGEELEADALPPELVRAGAVIAGPTHATPLSRVFAAGDCLPGGGTVAHAIGSGRRAADHVLAALGAVPLPAGLLAERGAAPEVAGPERIRPHWFGRAVPVGRRRVGPSDRLRGDAEVRTGFSSDAARAEAARCLSCGSCTGCDVCFMLCPDRAVLRAAPGAYGVDRDRCKGCGVCAEECPRGAVDLIAAPAPGASEGTRG